MARKLWSGQKSKKVLNVGQLREVASRRRLALFMEPRKHGAMDEVWRIFSPYESASDESRFEQFLQRNLKRLVLLFPFWLVNVLRYAVGWDRYQRGPRRGQRRYNERWQPYWLRGRLSITRRLVMCVCSKVGMQGTVREESLPDPCRPRNLRRMRQEFD